MAVANTQGDSLSVLLGNGDGTFQPQRVIPVGENPRAVAVFDVDGAGDRDIVTTTYDSDRLTHARNDGSGVFGPATPFEGGVAGERSLAAADMDEDGRLDLNTDDEIVRDTLVTRDGEVVSARIRELLGLEPLPEPEPAGTSEN